MSGTTWSKWFWSDWQSDAGVRICSFAAKGLWMDMLCIAAQHDPIGYVAVGGRALDSTALARLTGGSESEIADLLAELDRNGVFSRDRHGRIYSRRMISDVKKAERARKNGMRGGNPNLRNNEGNPLSVNRTPNHDVKPPDKGVDKPHKPEARIQTSSVPNGTGAAAPPNDDDLGEIRSLPVAKGCWRLALRVLVERGGMEDRPARAFVGKLKQMGLSDDDLWSLAEDAWKTGTQDPKPYMAAAAERIAQRRAGQLGVLDPPQRQQRVWCEDFREKPFQWKTHERGPRPGEQGCRISAAIQREYGFDPAEEEA